MAKTRNTKKPTKAEIEALANWQRLNAKWDKIVGFSSYTKVLKLRGKKGKVPQELLDFKGPTASVGRETRVIKSLSTGEENGSATKTENTKYTGTKMLGIATLHKSVAVPVFDAQDAVDISRMRR